MKRWLAIAFVVGAAALASAELENSVYTSKTEKLRLVVPRGWRSTDQPSYPGLLLWMMRSEPEGRLVLTSEPFTRDVYCSWPVRCQMSHDSLPAKAACALGSKLAGQRLQVGPVQGGPKENEDAGLPSVWFEYEGGNPRRFMRQAIAIDEDHVVSLVLSAPTAEARNANVRAFEQALRTLRPLTPEELGVAPAVPMLAQAAPTGSAAGSSALAGSNARAGSNAGAGTNVLPGSNALAGSNAAAGSGALAGSNANAGSASLPFLGSDAGSAAPPSATPRFQSAPPPRIEPVGACPRK